MKTEPIEALKVLIQCVFDAYDIEGEDIENIVHYDIAKDTAMKSFQEGQSSPKIKQLEWVGSEGGNVLTGIAIYAGYYRITSTLEGAFMRIATAGIRKRFDTVDEAKAAAQADFEKRVMECLYL